MIELTRSLARSIASVLRAAFRKPHGPYLPIVELSGDSQGLVVRAWHSEIAVEYRPPGMAQKGRALLPLDALKAVQGTDASPVTFENSRVDQAIARWNDR